MSRHEQIKNAYKYIGKEATLYDGMITCSTLPGRAVCRLVWNMGKAENDRYLERALSGIPRDFAGKLLEVPVGTGVLTMSVYRTLPNAEVTCKESSPFGEPLIEKSPLEAGMKKQTVVKKGQYRILLQIRHRQDHHLQLESKIYS